MTFSRQLIAAALFALGSCSLVWAATGRSSPASCPNFVTYATQPLPAIDNDPSLDEEVKPLRKLDHRLTGPDLERAFQCVVARISKKLRRVYQDEPVIADGGIYQFPASRLAYGRVLVSKNGYAAFDKGNLATATTLVKVNFDFDAKGDVLDLDVFVISNKSGALVYREFIGDSLITTTRCFECHQASKGTSVFFKPKYKGLKHAGAPQRLSFPKPPSGQSPR